jgi:amino acid transporter
VTSGPTSSDKQPGVISDSDLLQANATIIAGTLIFLTINSLVGVVPGFQITLLVGAILLPFSTSIIIIIVLWFTEPIRPSKKLSRLKTFTSAIGFLYLFVVVISLAYYQAHCYDLTYCLAQAPLTAMKPSQTAKGPPLPLAAAALAPKD